MRQNHHKNAETQRMKIYLDDERPAPDGWVLVKNATECLELLALKKGEIEELSLDHDLGTYATGYDVLLCIEYAVVHYDYKPPGKIHIHTANSSARPRMEQAVESIYKLYEEKQK